MVSTTHCSLEAACTQILPAVGTNEGRNVTDKDTGAGRSLYGHEPAPSTEGRANGHDGQPGSVAGAGVGSWRAESRPPGEQMGLLGFRWAAFLTPRAAARAPPGTASPENGQPGCARRARGLLRASCSPGGGSMLTGGGEKGGACPPRSPGVAEACRELSSLPAGPRRSSGAAGKTCFCVVLTTCILRVCKRP